MIKFAILRARKISKDGRILYEPIFEGQDGDLEREIASRVRAILGPKKNYTRAEIDRAIARAFETYKKDFKEQTIKLK